MSSNPVSPARPSPRALLKDLPDVDCSSIFLEMLLPVLLRKLAERMTSTKKTPQDLVLVLTGGPQIARTALRSSLSAHHEELKNPPPAGRVWVIVVTGRSARTGAVRTIRLDKRLLTVKPAMTTEQEQYVAALLRGTAPQIRALYYKNRDGKDTKRYAAFIHDTGPGLIEVDKLVPILTEHGYFGEADQLKNDPVPGRIWVWVSTWEVGGAVDLRAIPLRGTPLPPPAN